VFDDHGVTEHRRLHVASDQNIHVFKHGHVIVDSYLFYMEKSMNFLKEFIYYYVSSTLEIFLILQHRNSTSFTHI